MKTETLTKLINACLLHGNGLCFFFCSIFSAQGSVNSEIPIYFSQSKKLCAPEEYDFLLENLLEPLDFSWLVILNFSPKQTSSLLIMNKDCELFFTFDETRMSEAISRCNHLNFFVSLSFYANLHRLLNYICPYKMF